MVQIGLKLAFHLKEKCSTMHTRCSQDGCRLPSRVTATLLGYEPICISLGSCGIRGATKRVANSKHTGIVVARSNGSQYSIQGFCTNCELLIDVADLCRALESCPVTA